MIKITFPDNSVKEYAKGTTPLEIAKSISVTVSTDSAVEVMVGNRAVSRWVDLKEVVVGTCCCQRVGQSGIALIEVFEDDILDPGVGI